MNATLFLMTQKGFEVLKALVANNYASNIDNVVVGRDKNVLKDYADEIVHLCVEQGIHYLERSDLKTAQKTIDSPYSIAISWRWLISNTPNETSKLIVLHDSLLPKYRGFAPLVNALIQGEKEIGATALFANSEYDAGDILAQKSTQINYPIKIAEAIELVSKNYVDLTLSLFEKISQNQKLLGIPQNPQEATYSLWRNENDYLIDWTQSASQILSFINAVGSPYKGAATFVDGQQKIRILEAELVADVNIVNRDVGKVIFVRGQFPVIVCGKGLLKITKAIDDFEQASVLPFKNFRVRLYGRKLSF